LTFAAAFRPTYRLSMRRGTWNVLMPFIANSFCTKRPIVVEEKDLVESFVRGSGPGGQKINKSKNSVQLVHVPSGITVHCQEARDLTTNRKIARKLLRDKLDLEMHGAESKLGKRREKLKKQKKTAAR
jgi:peptide chain release factor